MSKTMGVSGLMGAVNIASLFLLITTLNPCAAQTEDRAPDVGHGEYLGSFYHIGLWVEDMAEMTDFLSTFMELTLVSRAERATGGERVIYQDTRGQRIELLSDPASVIPHPEFPLHPKGRVAGIAHIAIQVDDVVRLRDVLTARGYVVISQAPADYNDGYITSEVSEHRILFIAGPSQVTFELFEIREKTSPTRP
jgi:catechol 2,3-dioxygenase-like lactoylglutathione lyase family enzyme